LFSFLLGEHAQTVMATELEKQPSRISVSTGPYLEQEAGYNRKVFVDAVSYGQMAPNLPDWDRASRFLQDELDRMWLGKISVSEGTKTAAERVTAALHEES
jgi:ABC-type glycerol-3-phosphate transport system substrate-binding protein